MEHSTTSEMRTPLYERHLALKAKMIDFCGWKLPVYYQGIISEHKTVRNQVGLFDISHMGRVLIKGQDAEQFLDYISTNRLTGKESGSATYTVWCRQNGMCVDDVIVYKQSPDSFFVILNASNRIKDLDHLQEQASRFNVVIEDRFKEGILALQGPKAETLLKRIFPQVDTIKPMHFQSFFDQQEEIIVSRTGYTGSGGFELYGSAFSICRLWDLLLEQGKDLEIRPIGLGARDTLRLEMGYALYGHELSEAIGANETVAAWTIKWNKERFLGKEALDALEHSPGKRFSRGAILIDQGIARDGYPVLWKEQMIGTVTSGSFSPSLNQSIALLLLSEPLQLEEPIDILIRDKRVQAKITKIPFLNLNG